MFVSQSIQVFLVAILTFIGLVGFGLLTVRETTLASWLGEDAITAGDRYITGHLFGNRLLLSRQLIFVAGFVAAFAGLQFAVSVVNDAKYRSDFAEGMAIEVRQALAVRTAYLARASRLTGDRLRAMAVQVDPFALEILDDPYDTYARWRAVAPLYKVPHLDVHLVLSHGVVMDAIARVEDFSNNLTAFFMIDETGRQVMVAAGSDGGTDVLATADDPSTSCTGARSNRPFSEKRMADVEQDLRTMVGDLIDAHLASGTIEWVHGVSNILPIRAVAMLLGLPDGDSAELKFWSDEGIEVLSDSPTAPAWRNAWRTSMSSCATSASTWTPARADARRCCPRLVWSTRWLEPRSTATTTGTRRSACSCNSSEPAAIRRPASRVRVPLRSRRIPMCRRCYGRSRTSFPPSSRRCCVSKRRSAATSYVLRPCRLGDVDLRTDDRILLMWSTANRDPAVFDEPDELRVDRPTAKNHLGFGWGIHHCIGALWRGSKRGSRSRSYSPAPSR